MAREVLGSENGQGGEGCREPSSCWDVGGGGTRYAEGGEPPSVPAVCVTWGETGLPGEDRRGGRKEAFGDLSAHPVPERVHRRQRVRVGGQEVGAVCEDGEE